MKQILLFTSTVMALFAVSCTELLVSEAKNPATPDRTTLLTPSRIYASAALLAWTKPADNNFAAYTIYYDTIPGVTEKSIPGGSTTFKNDTSFLLRELACGTTYYVKVFVYNSASSSESNEIFFTTAACTSGVFTGETQGSMVRIPAGCFIGKDNSMGVITYDFFMDTAEVTIREWNAVMSTAGLIDTAAITMEQWEYLLSFDSSASLFPKTRCSWYLMILFCNEKSKRERRDTCYTYSSILIDTGSCQVREIRNLACNFNAGGYRLPTEDEWEYACRAGESAEFYWGKDGNTSMDFPYTATYPETAQDSAEISEYVWWANNNEPNGTKEVGLKKPNAWRLYDMIGNVEEAVWDLVTLEERKKNRINYTGPDAGPQSLKRVVVRGGTYNIDRAYMLTVWWRQSGTELNIVFAESLGLRTVRNATF